MSAAVLPEVLASVIFSSFDSIYNAHSPPDSNCVEARGACLDALGAFRSSLLDYVESIHSHMRLRLSAASRINQLPVDVLIRIFSVMPFKELITATHVCHHWRKAGLETAALWSDLTLHGPSLLDATALLARSKATPLDVWIYPLWQKGLRGYSSIAEIIPHLGRLRNLTIRPVVREPLAPDWREDDDQMPPHQMVLPLPSIIRMHAIQINWDDPRSRLVLVPPAIETAEADFTSLREVHILRGVDDIAFLQLCRNLRVLVLNIPTNVSASCVLQVLEANPSLRHLELRIHRRVVPVPRPAFDNTRICVVVPRCMDYFLLGEYCATGDSGRSTPFDRSQTEAMLYISCMDCSHIAHIVTTFDLGIDLDGMYPALLSQLRGITLLDCYGGVQKIEDERGHVIDLRDSFISGALMRALPLIEFHIRQLRVTSEEWSFLHERPGTVFTCLEELFLFTYTPSLLDSQPSATCPNLRTLTLFVRGFYRRDYYLPFFPVDDVWLVINIAAAALRVALGLRLHQLCILRISGPDLRNHTYRCHYPLPRVIHLSPNISSRAYGDSVVDDFPISNSYTPIS